MNLLAIELSSQQGSVALMKDGALLGEEVWTEERTQHNRLFTAIEKLLRDHSILGSSISAFAVGRGPGSFSGMRVAFAAAQAFALPDKKPVVAVASGAALALPVSREGAKEIAVVGDARRGQVWFGLFNVEQASSLSGETDGDACPALVQSGGWSLVPCGEIKIPEGVPVVSPDADRLRGVLPQLGRPCFPHARYIAELALSQKVSEPLEPLYMHPPVFIEPKYA